MFQFGSYLGPDFVNNFVGAVDSELHTHEQRSVDQTATWMSTGTTPSPLTVGSSPKIEPEKIKKWREDQKEVLERKGIWFQLNSFALLLYHRFL